MPSMKPMCVKQRKRNGEGTAYRLAMCILNSREKDRRERKKVDREWEGRTMAWDRLGVTGRGGKSSH